jgi:hypothetical protein
LIRLEDNDNIADVTVVNKAEEEPMVAEETTPEAAE